jgi:hypothetical protein
MIRDLRDYWIIRRSHLFDPFYYLITYPDIRKADTDPLMHFVKYGWKEGRNPSASFDTTFYLASNSDVSQHQINPLVHYIRYGKKEGRRILPTHR